MHNTIYFCQLCAAIGQLITGFEATCHFIVISQLPHLIDDFVNNNLDPVKVIVYYDVDFFNIGFVRVISR